MRSTVRPTVLRAIRGLAAVVLGLSVALGLAGCGGSDESGATDEPNASDSSATSDATDDPTESTATDEPADIDDGGEVATDQFAQMIRDGIEMTKSAHVSFTTTGGAGGLEGDGDVDYSASPPNMELTMKVTSQEIHMLLVDGVMYIESPQAEDKYLKYDLNDPNNPLGANFVDQLDPATAMTQFTAALSSVTSLGDEDVDGQTLAHYRMTIDTSKLQTATQSTQMPAELKTDVWLDDESRMAKSSIDLGQGTYDTTLSDFDEPVDIEAPADDQVVTQPAS